jgi:branched-chain amino acid transport system permease protein
VAFFIPDSLTITYAFAFSLVTLGLFVTISSGQFSVAHAALMGVGGYAAGLATVNWSAPFPVALLVGAAAAAALGLAMAFVLQRTAGILLCTVTIALGQAIALTIQNVPSLGGSQGYTGIPTHTTVWWAITLAASGFAVVLGVLRTRIGLDFLAVSRDETVSKALGISVLATRLWGFGVGGLLAGLGGGLIAHQNGLIQPSELSFAQEPKFFIYLLIGGYTSPWGALLGTLAMYYVQEVVLRFGRSSTLTIFGAHVLDYRDRFWILGLLLIIVVLTRPRGVLVRRSLRWRRAGEIAVVRTGAPGGT